MTRLYWFMAAIISASILSGWWSHDYTRKEYEKKISEIKLSYTQGMIAEQIKQSNTIKNMQEAADRESEIYFQRKMDNEETIDNLLSSISSGNKRVFVSTKKRNCSTEMQDPKPSSRTEKTNRAELSTEASRSLIEVGAEANECAIKFNSLLKRYNDLKSINSE